MADQQAVSPNAAQIEFWNSAASRAWADQYERMDRAVADLTKALLNMASPQPGEHVLDIGCGSGTTVLELAARRTRRSRPWRRYLRPILISSRSASGKVSEPARIEFPSP